MVGVPSHVLYLVALPVKSYKKGSHPGRYSGCQGNNAMGFGLLAETLGVEFIYCNMLITKS